MKALLYERKDSEVVCKACNRKCKIPPNYSGFCGVRYNIKNELLVVNWGIFIAVALDPIEKKPLYHFYPGSKALSLGTTGCSFACKYCLNWDISQRRKIVGIKLEPEEIIELAKENNTRIITFTYNEPSIYAEFSYEVSKLAKREGMKVTWVSNGYFTDELIDFISKFVDAVTIDIKGNGNEGFARKYISVLNYSETVLHAIEELYKKKVHVEVTDLVIPEIGDSLEDARKVSKRIYDIMGEESNIHFLRFYPEYKLSYLYQTPIETLERHARIAKEEGIRYVYIGNVPGHELENTYCPNCGKPVIERKGFTVYRVNLEDGRCKHCGYRVFLKGEARTSEIYYPEPIYLNKPFVERVIKDDRIEEREVK
ncbi:MAG: AmmeMemoRadiSam system radical SAM enzyme [Candidatus Nanoclepta minutus]|uniref:AmmeMemoRadiSam system radical SAM enzyme n=1 Tax=Candidatus Nanoclepta minutus TaxID=1940235 RepID=A0A397WPQ4_9ARCH|nr:MAG: AmmeMemoRadiSam system radical SAM enzyme [Candidatus Nanoclepta minutus]